MVRVKKSDKPLKVNVSSRLDPDVKAAIERLAAADNNRTLSQYIEIVLKDHIASRKPARRRMP